MVGVAGYWQPLVNPKPHPLHTKLCRNQNTQHLHNKPNKSFQMHTTIASKKQNKTLILQKQYHLIKKNQRMRRKWINAKICGIVRSYITLTSLHSIKSKHLMHGSTKEFSDIHLVEVLLIQSLLLCLCKWGSHNSWVKYGLPQGSVLGHILLLYMPPIGDIFKVAVFILILMIPSFTLPQNLVIPTRRVRDCFINSSFNKKRFWYKKYSKKKPR